MTRTDEFLNDLRAFARLERQAEEHEAHQDTAAADAASSTALVLAGRVLRELAAEVEAGAAVTIEGPDGQGVRA